MKKNKQIGVFGAAAFVLALVFMQGCVSPKNMKPDPYQPDIARQVWSWGTIGTTSVDQAVASTSRLLKKGDRITVYLTGIPVPDEVANIVNDLGEITLPLIGAMKLEGMTTADAERTIKKKYIEGDLYRNIDVIVMLQEGAFFVTGEVRAPGRYPVSGETTLLRAIAVAGGFTDFAERRKIELTRALTKQKEIHNADKIRAREAEDPPVRADDMITVYINRLGI